ncbi:Hypothetical protein SMAX5B_001388 [Scophthalmus maximus]|uniref:Uncharacterized protein n=1 Tax=Scophthalmus maximus TaxID=52904 RepID=A0A2U9CP34_SCOMX|nr:Hypothetical protein SMAX5B_001388 [Scophthalmus maximus]
MDIEALYESVNVTCTVNRSGWSIPGVSLKNKKHTDRGRNAIQLSSSVVGDQDAADTVVHSLDSVVT